jgi:hypothetical protein
MKHSSIMILGRVIHSNIIQKKKDNCIQKAFPLPITIILLSLRHVINEKHVTYNSLEFMLPLYM